MTSIFHSEVQSPGKCPGRPTGAAGRGGGCSVVPEVWGRDSLVLVTVGGWSWEVHPHRVCARLAGTIALPNCCHSDKYSEVCDSRAHCVSPNTHICIDCSFHKSESNNMSDTSG